MTKRYCRFQPSLTPTPCLVSHIAFHHFHQSTQKYQISNIVICRPSFLSSPLRRSTIVLFVAEKKDREAERRKLRNLGKDFCLVVWANFQSIIWQAMEKEWNKENIWKCFAVQVFSYCQEVLKVHRLFTARSSAAPSIKGKTSNNFL